jgi:hypothetical protein
MTYRVSFTGPASPDINQLLTAIAHRLNGHVSTAMAAEDPPASATQMMIKKCPNGQLPPCTDSDPHGPWLFVAHGPELVLGALALAFFAGFGVAMMLVLNKLKAR